MSPSENLRQANALPFAEISSRIERARQLAAGAPVQLVAVSKTRTSDVVRAAHLASGHCVFGENYVQEGVDKVLQLADLPLEWHFIGSLQSNKAKLIAAHFAWVHGVDRLSIAQALSKAMAALAPQTPPRAALKVLIQVNISAEATKHGVTAEAAPALCAAVAALPHLQLCGLMGMASPHHPQHSQVGQPDAEQRLTQEFAALAALYQQLAGHYQFTTLSMGMSDDFEVAIAHGATLVRIGSALFGARPPATIE